ncbi:MAG: sigma-70 family RNA polymerase sigma factor [Anaerolineales bacterium]
MSKKRRRPFGQAQNTESADDPGGPRYNEQTELQGLRDLDPQAITVIHNRYYPDVYRYARYRIDDAATAEDIAAEVFARLLEAVNAGRGPKTTLRGWLMGTASNLVNDHYRKSYKYQTSPLPEELQADSPGPAALVEKLEQHATVRTALKKLTPAQQNVLALRFGAGYSLEETANAIGKKVNAVKQLQFRALAALRRNIGEENV